MGCRDLVGWEAEQWGPPGQVKEEGDQELRVYQGNHQEENYHTGENKGYMVGMHNGSTWVNTGGILDYATDTFGNVASVNAPALNSSAACVEFGRSGI